MKTRIFISKVVLLLLVINSASSQNAGTPAVNDEPVKIFTTSETINLTESWISEYLQTNSDFNYELTPISFAEISSKIAGDHSIGFVMQQPDVSMSIGSMWLITLGREVVVTVMNTENPFAGELATKGVSPGRLAKLIEKQQDKNWGTLLDNKNSDPVKLYVLDEPEVKLSMSKFLEVDPTGINTLELKSQEAFLAAVKNDKYAIGFCNLSVIYEIEQQSFTSNIQLLPIDRNKNGRLDYNENFYANPEQFERSVWIGKYPHSMVYNIYAVSSSFPENTEINDFLSWIISSGQMFVGQNGFTELVYTEKQSNLEKLNPSILMAENQPAASTRSFALLWGILAVLAIILFVAVRRYIIRKQKAKAPLLSNAKYVRILDEKTLNFPGGLYFDKSHTWVFMGKDGRVRFGIDDFISKVTGNYTRVILKSPGEKVKRMEPVVTLIRNGKQITLNSPVSGTIKEINETLAADPYMINDQPYGDGWIYKIEPSNWFREIKFFKMGENYREWIKSELNRLKDFLACSLNIANMQEGKLAFQEGGELILHPLKDMEPKVWEDFQIYFINTADMY